MRKKIAVFIGVLIFAFFNEVVLDVVRAGPPLMPSSFWGTAIDNGADVPVGTVITAWINGDQYAETFSFSYSGFAVYSMDIPADDPSTPGIIEGGVDGDTIHFYIGGFETDQTGIWHSGTNQELNLSISIILDRTYLPLILN